MKHRRRKKTSQGIGKLPKPNQFFLNVGMRGAQKLAQQSADFREAWKLYRTDWRRRAELEARFLAKQSCAEIAAAMRLAEAVLKSYELWFFNVRGYLSNRVCVARVVLKIPASRNVGRQNVAKAWGWVAYCCGVAGLEELLTSVPRNALREKGIDAYLAPGVVLSESVRFLLEKLRGRPIRTPRPVKDEPEFAQDSWEYQKYLYFAGAAPPPPGLIRPHGEGLGMFEDLADFDSPVTSNPDSDFPEPPELPAPAVAGQDDWDSFMLPPTCETVDDF